MRVLRRLILNPERDTSSLEYLKQYNFWKRTHVSVFSHSVFFSYIPNRLIAFVEATQMFPFVWPLVGVAQFFRLYVILQSIYVDFSFKYLQMTVSRQVLKVLFAEGIFAIIPSDFQHSRRQLDGNCVLAGYVVNNKNCIYYSKIIIVKYYI